MRVGVSSSHTDSPQTGVRSLQIRESTMNAALDANDFQIIPETKTFFSVSEQRQPESTLSYHLLEDFQPTHVKGGVKGL